MIVASKYYSILIFSSSENIFTGVSAVSASTDSQQIWKKLFEKYLILASKVLLIFTDAIFI